VIESSGIAIGFSGVQEGTWVTAVTGYMGDSCPTDMGDKHFVVVVTGTALRVGTVAKS